MSRAHLTACAAILVAATAIVGTSAAATGASVRIRPERPLTS
jgi:hypothetical protein